MSLKKKTIRGSFTTVSGQGFKFLLRLASLSVLARLLTPEDYGIVAIASSIALVLAIFRDAGLSTATLQKPTLTQVEISSMYWLNVGLGLIVGLLLCASGPVAAKIYDQNSLISILPCFGLIAVLSSLSVQKSTLMQREMQFGRLVIADLISQTLGTAIGIITAYQGWGMWALVVSQVAAAVFYNICITFSSKWKPSFTYNHDAVKPMLRYGTSLMFSNLLKNTSKGIDALMIGYFFGQASVGIYNRAQNLLNIPMRNFVGPVNNVARAAIFRKAVDQSALQDSVAAILAIISMGSALLVISTLSFVQQAVTLILGDQWLACIPIFIALTPFAFVEPAATFLASVLISKGDSKKMLYWRFFSIFIILTGLVIGIKWGPVGMATTYGLSGLFVRMPLFVIYTSRATELNTKLILSYIAPNLIPGTIAAGLAIYAHHTGFSHSILNACITLAGSILFFFAAVALFPKGRDTFRLLRWIFNKNKKERSLASIMRREQKFAYSS